MAWIVRDVTEYENTALVLGAPLTMLVRVGWGCDTLCEPLVL